MLIAQQRTTLNQFAASGRVVGRSERLSAASFVDLPLELVNAGERIAIEAFAPALQFSVILFLFFLSVFFFTFSVHSSVPYGSRRI